MQRLTNTTRDQIIDAAIEKSGHPQRVEALAAAEYRLAEDLRILSLGGSEKAAELEALAVRIREATAGMDETYPCFRAETGSYVEVIDHGKRRRFAFAADCGYRLRPDRFYIPVGHEASLWIAAYDAQAEGVSRQREEVRQAVSAIVYSVHNVKALLRAWPECAELLPNPAPIVNLPAIPVAAVNALLGLPSAKPEEVQYREYRGFPPSPPSPAPEVPACQ